MSIRMRVNRAKTGKRRSHQQLAQPRLSECEQCGNMHARHAACAHCGYYRGRQVMRVAEHAQKKEAKAQARAEALRQQQAADDGAADTASAEQTDTDK